jgi:hypothetical protein
LPAGDGDFAHDFGAGPELSNRQREEFGDAVAGAATDDQKGRVAGHLLGAEVGEEGEVFGFR